MNGYRDEWGEWHDYGAPDLGYTGVHEPGHFDRIQAQAAPRRSESHAEPRRTRKRTPAPPITDEQALGLLARLRKSIAGGDE